MTDVDTALRAAALESKAWPFEEARKLLARYPNGKPSADGQPSPILFETGYGPSGLPHIGTFNEVLRTTMVRRAFAALSDQPTRLVAFSDDMDGLRKVPDNVPNGAMLAEHLGKPLSRIPDPFGTHDSFAAHNNAMLRQFLDRFGFEYEFASSTEYYASGRFDDALKLVLRHYDAIQAVMLPTLRAERRASYSPVLPVSPTSGVVLQVPVEVVDADAGTIAFTDESGERIVRSALGGLAKLQWKVDWAMRWVALGVDYEMAGKDLIDSVTQSGKIARVLGGRPPEGFTYEMFLDEKGEKISKSKGNGLSLDQWLTYGPEESLAFFAYREPKKAKQLHMGVIPRAVDEYWQFHGAYPGQAIKEQLGNPVHHIHGGEVPTGTLPVTFGLLLNLVGVMGDATREQVWGYLANYVPDATPESEPELDRLIGHALAYARDFVAPTLVRRAPEGVEVDALRRLDAELAALPADASAEDIQNIVYEIGKGQFGDGGGFESLRDWFKALYETLLGSSQGPRMGSFIKLYGIKNSRALIAQALERVAA
ncbi:lysine--tRNA ligase [Sphingomonas aerophila]|uniref:Lysine--tRNA ligase n=1 Tax=Sphingomonas aerophila TaxID=1344948 RepID=A0A7W9BA50_9SPHN|nr:lysine--tRNA ligase [Sphingomonas aerophila]MBB5713447.1 lysyl-tRNA synthetase class 1 [Sphingomonas aerophila]